MDANSFEEETLTAQRGDLVLEDQIEIDFDDFDLEPQSQDTRGKNKQKEMLPVTDNDQNEKSKVVGSLMAPDEESDSASSEDDFNESDSLDLGDLGAPKIEEANNTVDDDDEFFGEEAEKQEKYREKGKVASQSEEHKIIEQPEPEKVKFKTEYTNRKQKMSLTIDE